MSNFTFNPTPLYRLIENTDFLCCEKSDSNDEAFKESEILSCFNPEDFYKLITVIASSLIDNNVPENLRKTYYFDPSKLYGLIETKSWDKARQRIFEYPEECALWIIKKKKNGTLRWKLLPLHAVLLLKAPVEVILQTLQSFPEAAKCADDQGMLPLHIALSNDNIDEVIIKKLIQENPKGLLHKDSCGRTPLAIKGEVTASCFSATLELEKINISRKEKESFQQKLSFEKEMHSEKIKEIKNEVDALFRNFTGKEIEYLEKLDVISMQQNEILEMKLSEIDLVHQNESSLNSLEIQQKNSNKDAQEIAWLHALTTQQGREINELKQKVEEQRTKISQLKAGKKVMKASLLNQKEISTNLQTQVDVINKNINHLRNSAQLQSKIVSHVETMKRQQQVCDLLTSQIRTLEVELEKDRENRHVEVPAHQVDQSWTKNFSTLFQNITNVVLESQIN